MVIHSTHERADKKGSTLFIQELEMHEVMEMPSADLWSSKHNKRRTLDPSPQCRKDYQMHRDHYNGKAVRGGRKEWYNGFTKLSEVNDLLRDGWSEGHERTRVLSEQVAADCGYLQVADTRRVRVNSDQGDEIDMDRYLRGEVDSMFFTKKRMGRKLDQSVTIFAPWGGNCSRSSEELFWQGAATMALVDILEEHGFSVELKLICYLTNSSNESNEQVNIIRLKEGDQPLRPEIASTYLCHAGIFRTIGFTAICANLAGTNGGLCSVKNPRDLKASGFIPGQGIVMDQAWNREAARKEVQRSLEELNLIEPEIV